MRSAITQLTMQLWNLFGTFRMAVNSIRWRPKQKLSEFQSVVFGPAD